MQDKYAVLRQMGALITCLGELRHFSRTSVMQRDPNVGRWEKALYAMIDTLLDEAVKMEWDNG